MFSDFHFIRPEWLLLIVPAVGLYFLIKRFSNNQMQWDGVLAKHLLSELIPTKAKNHSSSIGYRVMLALFIVAIIGGAGPTLNQLPQPVMSLNQGHVLLMDMSLSMRATDLTPDRLTRAQYKAIDLVKKINEGEIGVVAYAGDAFTIVPLTKDVSTIESLVPSLSPEIMPVPGSNPLLGLQHAIDLLEQAGHPNGQVHWISDGIDIESQRDINEWLSDKSIKLNLIAVGTDQGAPIKQADGSFVTDRQGSIVLPRLNFSAMAPLASKTGGVATTIASDDRDIDLIIQNISALELAEQATLDSSITGDQWQDLGPYVIWIALPLLCYLFRRGSIGMFIVAFSFIGPMNESAIAQESEASLLQTARSWFMNGDQRGLEAYESEQFKEAANAFEDSAWRGSAHYKNGDYEQALDQFSKRDDAQAWYNQGNALAQMQRFEEALSAYDAALERSPDFTNAAENKALIEKLLEQQKEQQENQEQQQDQSQSDESESPQDQSNSADNADNSNQQSSQNDSSNSQEQSEQSQSQDQSDPSQNENKENENLQEQAEKKEPEELEKKGNSINEPSEMTDEQREEQQKMKNLLRKIPNDPGFLLKRKMLLESQNRKTRRMPSGKEIEW